MKRITSLDFVRAILTLGIVAYHFSCYSSAGLSFFNTYANGVWGGTYNAAFFVLSGFCIENKYGKESFSVVQYYYKRWKTVVVPYALVFSFAYLNNVAVTGHFFYLDIPKWRLLLSFIGEDGYVQWFYNTYFVTGVWFIGAIIIVYLLFPLLNWAIKRSQICSLLVLFVLYELIRLNNKGESPIDINLIVCILSFSVGMILSIFKSHLFGKAVFALTATISVIFIFIPMGGSISTKQLFLGWSLFILFSNIGNRITLKRINHFAELLSKASYPMILIHLPLIHKVLIGWNSTNRWHSLAVLTALTVVLCVLGLSIDVILNKVYSLKGFKWLDTRFQAISEKSSIV